MSWRRTNPSLWVSPKALNNVLFCSNEVKLYLSLDKGRLVGYQQLEFEWQIPCVPIYLFLSIWWEDILVTGANLCSNTFFIWAPFNLVLLLSQLPASPQFRPADTNMRLFRELDSAQEAFMRMRALGAQVTVEKCRTVLQCMGVVVYWRITAYSLLSTPHKGCTWWVPATSSVEFSGESECLCPGEDLRGKQILQHMQIYSLLTLHGTTKTFIIERWRQLESRSESAVWVQLSCLKAFILLWERFAMLPY